MKKYFIPAVAFVLIAAAANAQATTKKPGTDNAAAKMNKPAVKKVTATTAAVTPSTPAAAPAKKTDVAGIKRKQHKKTKSVKPVSK